MKTLALPLALAALVAAPAPAFADDAPASIADAAETAPVPAESAPSATPTPTPTAAPEDVIPADLAVVDVPIPVEWKAEGERLAAEFAASHGYGDACAGRNITALVASNLPELAGPRVIGLAWVGGPRPSCRLAIAPSETVDRCAYVRVYVHERLHLARNDGWHADGDDQNPVGGTWTPPSCVYLPGAASPSPVTPAPTAPTGTAASIPPAIPVYGHLTRAQAKVAVRKRLSRRWKVTVCGSTALGRRTLTLSVCAEKKTRQHGRARTISREYEAARIAGRVALERTR